MTVRVPSEVIQKYSQPQESGANKGRELIVLAKDYPYPLPRVIYTGKTYHHLNVNLHSSSDTSLNSESTASSYIDDDLVADFHALNLDPLKWKEQDHYMLLGLSVKRHEATDMDIKKAYRKMVLKYHPDKKNLQANIAAEKASSTGSPSASPSLLPEDEDSVFKCIQKAYELLSDPVKRRQYDSVDHAFDESIPKPISAKKLAENPKAFYDIYRPVFHRNARFSKKKPVPDLGFADSPRDQVEEFYSFWMNFESTRSFEYLDEEESETADNRYDKRYLEKKNKAARLKRKTEDNARLIKLVEQSMSQDPRIRAFKEFDKAEKERLKAERKTNVHYAKSAARIPTPASPTRPGKMSGPPKMVPAPIPVPSPELAPKTAQPTVEWAIEEMKCLIVAVNKIPGGSRERWEKIAEYVATHSKLPCRNSADVVKKAHELKHIRDVDAFQREMKKKVDQRIYKS